MAREGTQKKLERVRPPRVNISYDVETGGAIETKELPFLMGVLADLSGNPKEALPRISAAACRATTSSKRSFRTRSTTPAQ
jgi:type VI secretion system protein ImpB